ncbi:TonB-dependent receptor plug domain-containing protein [Skermanella stibiiresistens]|uniref:TonB-dependent receptor plug domain-containing protein n=1 Tax=Skermanella stibiiresistens TaxID=913326 RepID=UPI0004AEDF38|nr:Plug domain-containing protein [Skermanella stibiiresistens]
MPFSYPTFFSSKSFRAPSNGGVILTGAVAALALPLCGASPAAALDARRLPPVPVETAPPPELSGAAPSGVTAPEGGHRTGAPAALASTGDAPSTPLATTTVAGAALVARRLSSSDAAALLRDVPGMSLAAGGGVSSLPSLDGLLGDRLKQLVNGVPVTAACPNHMNPPFSYIDAANVEGPGVRRSHTGQRRR